MHRDARISGPILSATFLSARSLAERGVTRHGVQQLLNAGRLTRLRRDRYVDSTMCPELQQAGRHGGRLDCVSLLSLLGVFVRATTGLHVQFDVGASRLPARPRNVTPHWRVSRQPRTSMSAPLIEALAQAVRCQMPRDAVATLDSAWHLGLITEIDIAEVFALLPRRYRRLRQLLDRRSESGPETLMRLLLRGLGRDVEIQVDISGVGRVDFVVDGWLIIECDSKAHHEGWDAQRRDRRRDIAAAARGYTTIRPLAEDILFNYGEILEQVRAILNAGPTFRPHNSSRRSTRAF